MTKITIGVLSILPIVLLCFFIGLTINTAFAQQCYTNAEDAYAHLLAQKQAAKQYRININTASAADFLSLEGVGVVTAEAIVAYRRQVGRFHSIDELLQVKGIGEKTLAKNRHRLTVQ